MLLYQLFTVGGISGEDQFHSSTEYLTADGGWEYGPELPSKLVSHCQVTAGSDVYVFGE